MNNKLESLRSLSIQFYHETKDFKSWVLNKYPLNSYFKRLLRENKTNPKILSSSHPLSISPPQNLSTIYIGETQANSKHGYGL